MLIQGCCSERFVLPYFHRGVSRSRFTAVRSVRGRPWTLRTCCLGKSDDRKLESGRGEPSHFNSQKEEIGANYGEGFTSFKVRDEVEHVDVDHLNIAMQTQGAERLKHAMNPDQAIGVIFYFEGVLTSAEAVRDAAKISRGKESEMSMPSSTPIYDLHPLHAAALDPTAPYCLTEEETEACIQSLSGTPLQEGVLEWLTALKNCQVPCGVISNMSRHVVRTVLSNMDLLDFFQSDTCLEDGMQTLAQKHLSASMKLGRPPNKCVVFTSTPQGAAAAHNCTMKAVAVLGEYKGYQLKQADLTCAKMDELSVYNLRRLFANSGTEFMDTMKERDNTEQSKSITRVASSNR